MWEVGVEEMVGVVEGSPERREVKMRRLWWNRERVGGLERVSDM